VNQNCLEGELRTTQTTAKYTYLHPSTPKYTKTLDAKSNSTKTLLIVDVIVYLGQSGQVNSFVARFSDLFVFFMTF